MAEYRSNNAERNCRHNDDGLEVGTEGNGEQEVDHPEGKDKIFHEVADTFFTRRLPTHVTIGKARILPGQLGQYICVEAGHDGRGGANWIDVGGNHGCTFGIPSLYIG